MSARPVLRWAARTLAAAALLVAAPTWANGRFPAANQLVASHPDRLLLRATFGLVLSRDRGSTWEWICEDAVGFSGNQDPAVALTPAGTLLAGLAEGLALSQDGGCGWRFAAQGLERQLVIDVAVRKAAPAASYALTSTLAPTDGGAPSFASQLFRSEDDGASWTRVGTPFDPSVRLETVEVAEADPQRLYVSGVRGGGSSAQGVLFVSRDGGGTWQELPVALEAPSEKAPYLAAVDPAEANRLYVRTSGVASGRILLSTDAGATFRAIYASKGPLLGFALSPDGSSIFAGGPRDGLLAAARGSETFEPRASLEVQCLATEGDALWACSNDTTSFLLGLSRDGGRTFQPKLRLPELKGVLACAAPDQPAKCAARWPELRTQIGAGTGGAEPAPDAGAADAPIAVADAGTTTPPAKDEDEGSGCALGPRGTAPAGGVLLAILALYGIRRAGGRHNQARRRDRP